MRTIVWGFGDYYEKKEKSIQKDSIIAFVSNKGMGGFGTTDIIAPKDIFHLKYDYLYIMTDPKVAFEIIDELKQLKYQDWNKVIFGWNLKPYTREEKLIFEDGEIKFDLEGNCIYSSPDCIVKMENKEDWNKLKQRKNRYKKKNVISIIPCNPISNIFGMERGLPIDRYYIEKFLDENARYIKGTVLEVAGREYTMKYGSDIEKSISMHICDAPRKDSIIANLETGEGVVDELVDCFVLTQTLLCIFDVKVAAQNVIRFLKKGGVALITVSGITQISRYDMDRWGHYWSFTTASLKRLFEECKDVESVEITAYGNVKSSASGLYGLAVEDMDEADLIYHDDDYQQIIAAVVKKIG